MLLIVVLDGCCGGDGNDDSVTKLDDLDGFTCWDGSDGSSNCTPPCESCHSNPGGTPGDGTRLARAVIDGTVVDDEGSGKIPNLMSSGTDVNEERAVGSGSLSVAVLAVVDVSCRIVVEDVDGASPDADVVVVPASDDEEQASGPSTTCVTLLPSPQVSSPMDDDSRRSVGGG